MIRFYHLWKSKILLFTAVLTCAFFFGTHRVPAAGTEYEDKLFEPSYVHSIEISMAVIMVIARMVLLPAWALLRFTFSRVSMSMALSS